MGRGPLGSRAGALRRPITPSIRSYRRYVGPVARRDKCFLHSGDCGVSALASGVEIQIAEQDSENKPALPQRPWIRRCRDHWRVP